MRNIWMDVWMTNGWMDGKPSNISFLLRKGNELMVIWTVWEGECQIESVS